MPVLPVLSVYWCCLRQIMKLLSQNNVSVVVIAYCWLPGQKACDWLEQWVIYELAKRSFVGTVKPFYLPVCKQCTFQIYSEDQMTNLSIWRHHGTPLIRSGQRIVINIYKDVSICFYCSSSSNVLLRWSMLVSVQQPLVRMGATTTKNTAIAHRCEPNVWSRCSLIRCRSHYRQTHS